MPLVLWETEPIATDRDDLVFVRPERYFERFFQETARRLNYIRLIQGRHFEARRFFDDLRKSLLQRSEPPSARA